MPDCVLKSFEIPLPGAYIYTIGGHKYTEPIAEGLAMRLSAFRKGNSKPRSSLAECLEDISKAQCIRLGCNPTYCRPLDGSTTQVLSISPAHPFVAPCKGCGGFVTG